MDDIISIIERGHLDLHIGYDLVGGRWHARVDDIYGGTVAQGSNSSLRVLIDSIHKQLHQ